MHVTLEQALGLFAVAIPLLAIAALVFWRRQRPVFWFACALVAVGLGYLAFSGAAADIGAGLLRR
ncbi:MAG: hypothetical protein AB7F96_02075 [Beijerinckiaceae bacterium]